MPIGVVILVIACAYIVIFSLFVSLKKHRQANERKTRQEGVDKRVIIGIFGGILLFIAYMIIIPTPKPGSDRWLNSVLVLRLFWKTLGSLLATVGTYGVAALIGTGISALFGKKERTSKKTRQIGWKSLDRTEALEAFNELYEFEYKKVQFALTAGNVTNAHEGWYGRYNNKMEQVAKSAPLAEIRIAAIQKLRNTNQLMLCLNSERDDNVRKVIELEISKKRASNS